MAKDVTVCTLKRISTHILKCIHYIEIYVLIMIFFNLFVTFGEYERLTISFEKLINKGKDPEDHFF